MKKHIFCVKREKLSYDELALFTCLQGLVNEKEKELLLDVDNYLSFLSLEEYEIEDVSFVTVKERYLPSFSSYILYHLAPSSTEINAAFSISAATGALAVPDTLEGLVKGKIELIEDLTKLNLDNLGVQKYAFAKYKDRLAKDGLIHQPIAKDYENFLIPLRDFAITKKWFVLYVDESEEQRRFLDEVLLYLDKGICIYGWTSDEISFVSQISKYGDAIIPMDWSSNHSFFGTFSPRKIERKKHFEEIKPNKHYLSFVVSDGDNVQWLERDYCFSSFYKDFASVKRNYPLTMSISPALIDLNPRCLEYIYEHVTNEDFICGVSGYGYMNPCLFPREYLPSYLKKTNEYLSLMEVSVVMLLDNLQDMSKENVDYVLSEYADCPNIIGGVYEIDPSKYEGGKGQIFWAKGKPFISVKASLWNTFSSKEEEKANKEALISNLASFINSLPVAPNEESGYSVINVHPWSTTCLDLDKLVNLLGNNVQILGIEQLISLMKENIKR